MISTERLVVVEGKYDKITLQNVIDATIISTDGFSIFKDVQKRELIRKIALKNGVAVLTDSDSAGMVIRSFIKNFCAGANIVNVYIPKIKGKEKRKTAAGKEGLLGVEGMSEEVLKEAFMRSGINLSKPLKSKITKQRLYTLGLSGGYNSTQQRNELSKFLDIPVGMSSNGFVDALNSLYSVDEFERQVKLWRQETDKR